MVTFLLVFVLHCLFIVPNNILLYRQEVKLVHKGNYVKAAIITPLFIAAKLIVYATFLTYILSGHFITAEKVIEQRKMIVLVLM